MHQTDIATVGIPITPAQAKEILWRNTSPDMRVMCRGYSDDDENFTELVWSDDKNLAFWDADTYPEFQLWLRFRPDPERHGA